ncbi:hypothetical protein CRUP_027303 [Coryphaenoides rupestris]|nr:hypothetical protein CRUP_027303 [Coryphaenoides rupestris]
MATKADPLSSTGSPLWMTREPPPGPTSTRTRGENPVDLHHHPEPPTSTRTQGENPVATDKAGDDVFLPPPPQLTAPPPPPLGGAVPLARKTHVHDPGVSRACGGEATEAEGNPPPGLGLHPAERGEAVVDKVTGSERTEEENQNPEEPGDMEAKTLCEEEQEEEDIASQDIERNNAAGGCGTLTQTSCIGSEEACGPTEEGSGEHSGGAGETTSATRDLDVEYKASSDSPPPDLHDSRGEEESGDPQWPTREANKHKTKSLEGECVGSVGPDWLASNMTNLAGSVTAEGEKHHPKDLRGNVMEDVLVAEVTIHGDGGQRIDVRLECGVAQEGARAISSVLQQGELLLQRLQWVQDRQDTQQPPTAGVSVGRMAGCEEEEVDVERGVPWNQGESLGTEGESGADDEEDARGIEHRHSLVEEEDGQTKSERREEGVNKGGIAAMPVDPSPGTGPHHRIPRVQDIPGQVTADLSPIHTQELSSATTTTTTMTSVAEIRENLEKSRVPFKLTDNPVLLEIPFKTPVLLKRLQDDSAQSLAWQKEVGQGRAPGEYAEEGTRQLKGPKTRLFQSLQRGSVQGAVRLSRTPITGPISPSILEHTRSLELLSLRSQPLCRTQSLLVPGPVGSERGRRWERSCRSRGPTAGSSPYLRRDPHQPHHRSMDSLDVVDGAKGTRKKTRREPKALLGENPFFKLRPALAQPTEVQKDIHEARERDEELRRLRCVLYGESRETQEEEDDDDDNDDSQASTHGAADARQQSRGKLDRIWPPPPRPGEQRSSQTQGPWTPRPGGHVTGLSHRWEAGPNTTDQSS